MSKCLEHILALSARKDLSQRLTVVISRLHRLSCSREIFAQSFVHEIENLNDPLNISSPVALLNHVFKCNAEPLRTG